MSNLQSLLVLVAGSRILQLAIQHLEERVVGTAVASAGVHTVSAKQDTQAIGREAIGVIPVSYTHLCLSSCCRLPPVLLQPLLPH